MRFGILGPLEVRDEVGAPVALGGPRPRALLATTPPPPQPGRSRPTG